MAIVAPGVARFSVVGEYAGQDHVNIFDINVSDVEIGTGRDTELFEIAGDLLNQWNDHILPLLNPQYTAREVRWVDLDSLDGSTGSRSSTDGSTWPENGTQSGDPMPGNVVMRVRKQINGARGRRAGQTRLSAMSEGYTLGGSANGWDPAALTAFNEAFEELRDGINGGIEGNSTRNMVVVHTVDDVYVADSNITRFTAIGTVGSQRGRLPGYGS